LKNDKFRSIQSIHLALKDDEERIGHMIPFKKKKHEFIFKNRIKNEDAIIE